MEKRNQIKIVRIVKKKNDEKRLVFLYNRNEKMEEGI